MTETKKKVIAQYKGRLTPQQAAEGITVALTNAKALVKDSELLLEHERYPRAAALAILAIEEAGKVSLIRALLLARDESEVREEWRAYRSHTKKNVLYILPDLAARGAKSSQDLWPTMGPNSDHPEVLEALKQVALYTDAYGACRWSLPGDAITSDIATSLVSVARLLSQGGAPMTTAQELELWVKHVGPVWKKEMWEMRQALAACYAEAEERGFLKGQSSAAELVRFLFGIS